MIRAAGIIIQCPETGRFLLLRRAGGARDWDYAGGKCREGETIEECAIREVFEETGFRCGHSGRFLCRRVSDGTDYSTFHYLTDEFIPKLSKSHTDYLWVKPSDVLDDVLPAKGR
jgi:8-oxo-dGTP pyrophosphatase MutT (NUDIX family)